MNKNAHGVLGMNARNLLYVKPYNRGSAIRLANNKLRSKEALYKAGIPVPKVYGIIRNRKELEVFKWDTLPKSFVLKPNHGGGGEGIIVIFGQSKDLSWVSTKGEKITISDLSSHILNIFEGFYSISGINDIAFFEERIKLSKTFKPYAYKGIPDIRVIVFNKVPVMAMLRLPTKESGGKANLHQGGIGVGIDISTGVTTHAIMYDQLIEKTPDTKLILHGVKIPYWREILEIAIKCQEISKLGYVGVDIAMDRERGPVVLEINAHPGLSIQNANLASLKYRLQKVTGIKVKNEAHGIRLAQDLFGGEIQQEIEEISGKQIVGIVELIKIMSEGKEDTELKAKIDTGADLSSMDKNLAKELGYEGEINEFDEEVKNMQIGEKADKAELDKKIKDKITKWGDRFDTVFVKSSHGSSYRLVIKMDVSLAGKDIVSKMTITDRSSLEFPIIIGRKDLGKFLVDPSKSQTSIVQRLDYGSISSLKNKGIGAIISSISASEKDMAEVNLNAIKKLSYYSAETEKAAGKFNDVYSFINPFGKGGKDYASEVEDFLANADNKEYNPTFYYPTLVNVKAKNLETAMGKLDDILKMAKIEDNECLKHIVQESIVLMKYKLSFLTAVMEKNEAMSFEYAKKIYGDISQELLKKAEDVYNEILAAKDEQVNDESYLNLKKTIFDDGAIKDKFKEALLAMGINGWDVVIDKDSSQIDVKFNSPKYEKPTIVIPEGRRLNGVNLMRSIIHEIVHVKTNSNNKEIGLGGVIFGRDYELYQEGLARITENDLMNDIFGVRKELPNPYYVLAMNRIRKGDSYHKAFDYIYELKVREHSSSGMDEEAVAKLSRKESLFILRRVFRGFRDSLSRGGAYFPKDKMYLEGEMLARKIIDSGFGEYMVAAKIDPSLLPLFIKLGIVRKEKVRYKLENDLGIYRKIFLK